MSNYFSYKRTPRIPKGKTELGYVLELVVSPHQNFSKAMVVKLHYLQQQQQHSLLSQAS
jgi:hypothetical protein